MSPRIRNQIPDGYSWTIDPLDGTKNFVKGKPAFCSMIALLWNGRPIECWIWQPLVKILFYASDYCGAFRIDEFSETRLRIEGRPFEVDLMCGSGNSLGLEDTKKDLLQERLLGLDNRRFPGSAGIQACLIANGEEDYLIHGNSTPWDHASPVDFVPYGWRLCCDVGRPRTFSRVNGGAFHGGLQLSGLEGPQKGCVV